MKTAKEFRASAKAALSGKYWWAVLASLIASVLGGTASSGPQFNYNVNQDNVDQFQSFFSDNPEIIQGLLIALTSLVSVMVVYSLVVFIIGGAVELGYNRFNVSLFKVAQKPVISDLFSRFDIFGKALGLRLLMWIKTLLWTLLLIVPGIIASYRYALAPYLMADHPEYTAKEAIQRSKELMHGHKWRMFCLGFSFIGWILLACLTAGVGFVFLAPYMKAATTAFYLERVGQEAQAEAPVNADPFLDSSVPNQI